MNFTTQSRSAPGRPDDRHALAGGGELDDQARSISVRLSELVELASRLVRLRAERGKLRAQRAAFLAALVALAFIGATGAVLAGVVLLARGLSRTAAELLGTSEGVGQLVSGVLLIAAVLSLVTAASVWNERRVLRRLRKRHGRESGSSKSN